MMLILCCNYFFFFFFCLLACTEQEEKEPNRFLFPLYPQKKQQQTKGGEPCTEGETMDLGVQEKKSPLGETLGKIIIKQDQTLFF